MNPSEVHQREIDETHIHTCLTLAKESLEMGDLPFGALLVRNQEVVAKAHNTGTNNITGHAEVNALKDFIQNNSVEELRECTLYTNFEPCAMCSFLIRDYGIPRVVFSVYSPHVGGYSKWDILGTHIKPEFTWHGHSTAPSVTGGVLELVGNEMFDKLNWLMHHPNR